MANGITLGSGCKLEPGLGDWRATVFGRVNVRATDRAGESLMTGKVSADESYVDYRPVRSLIESLTERGSFCGERFMIFIKESSSICES